MNTNNNDNLSRGDILAEKLRLIRQTTFPDTSTDSPPDTFPEGLEDKIMLRVQAGIAMAGRRRVFRYIAAYVAAAGGAFGVIFAVLYFTGITGSEISSLFSPIGNLFGSIGESMENVASAWSPTYSIALSILLIGIIYLLINEIISSRAIRKVLEKELDV